MNMKKFATAALSLVMAFGAIVPYAAQPVSAAWNDKVDKDGNPLTIEDTIADDTDLSEELEMKTRWSQVKSYIENMDDERAREIIILRYGLNNKKPLTQREVAERLNISRSYVSRIEKKTLSDIRKSLK